MAGAKEIRGKIASIKNTQKITKAMEMVAASKMRKAQERMRAAIGPMRKRSARSSGTLRSGESGLQASVHRGAPGPRRRHHRGEHRPRTVRGAQPEFVQGGARPHPRGADRTNIEASTSALPGPQGGAVLPPARSGVELSASATHTGRSLRKAKDLIGAIKVMLDLYGEEKIDRLLLIVTTCS